MQRGPSTINSSPAPDDIILFASGDWSFWGDLSCYEAAQCETRDCSVIRFGSAQWQELVGQEDRS